MSERPQTLAPTGRSPVTTALPSTAPPLRIVLVLSDPPLPFGNAAARWFSLLMDELPRRGHRLTTFVSCDPAAEAETRRLYPDDGCDIRYFRRAARCGWRDRWRSLTRPNSYLYSDQMIAAVHEELKQPYDVLHLEHLWGGYVSPAARSRAFINIHYLFSSDWGGSSSGSIKERVLRRFIRRAERRLVRSHRYVATLTPQLIDSVRQMHPWAQAAVLPITIQPAHYPYREPRSPSPTLGLIGSFNWTPTLNAARQLLRLWPAIRQRVPNVRLRLIGRDAVRLLGSFANDAQIDVEENVPDILPHFHSLDVMAYAPDGGSGIKVKVLESFATGPAVVTNRFGVEGLPVEDGQHVRIAESDDAVVDACCELLGDEDARVRQSRLARDWLEDVWSPQHVVDRTEQFYRQIDAMALPMGRSS